MEQNQELQLLLAPLIWLLNKKQKLVFKDLPQEKDRRSNRLKRSQIS